MAGALVALGPAGERLELRVDATGALLVAGGTGGGGAGDASAANQLTQITREAEIRDRIILPAALDADGGLKSHIQNFPATQPVSGTVALDAATLAALESITATIANWPAVQPVSDNASSLTVDAPVGTPVFVRLSDGTAAIATLPVSGPLTDAQLRASAVPMSLASVPAHQVQGRAAITTPAAVADGAAVALMADKYGRQVIAPAPQDLWVQGRATLTTNASTQVIAAGGAGIKTAISSISATNTSATAVRLDILDGSTLIHSVQLPASASAPQLIFDPPIVGTAATALNVQLAASVTDVRVYITGFRVL